MSQLGCLRGALLALAVGCGGAGEAISPGIGDAAPAEAASVIEGTPIVGRVWLGAPVIGATVEVNTFDELALGRSLGMTTTNAEGRFAVPDPGGYRGRVLVRAYGEGARYQNVVSASEERFDATDDLVATFVLADSTTDIEVEVDALTTLTTYYAIALRPSEGAERALTLSVDRFSAHAHPTVFDPAEASQADLDSRLDWPTPAAASLRAAPSGSSSRLFRKRSTTRSDMPGPKPSCSK